MFDIFDKLVSQSWLYEKVFWKLLPDLVYDQEVEKRKNLLIETYGFKDVNKVFKKEIERGEFENMSKIIFKYNESQKEPQRGSWFFGFWNNNNSNNQN